MRTSTRPVGLPGHFSAREGMSAVGHEPAICTRIYDRHIHLCILQRVLDADIKRYAAHVCQEYVGFELAQPINVAYARATLKTLLPPHPTVSAFAEDVGWVVEMFACLFDLANVGLRLNVLTKTMCLRFHTDKVPCRLIATCAGKGTEWLDHKSVDHVMLAACNEFNEKAGRFAGQTPIQCLQEGEIVLLKAD